MTPHEMKIYEYQALVFAEVAAIEGMKAENSDRLSQGLSIAYGEEAFVESSKKIEFYAHAMAEGE